MEKYRVSIASRHPKNVRKFFKEQFPSRGAAVTQCQFMQHLYKKFVIHHPCGREETIKFDKN